MPPPRIVDEDTVTLVKTQTEKKTQNSPNQLLTWVCLWLCYAV